MSDTLSGIVGVPLDDDRYFVSLNGLWTGKKPPYVRAGVIRNTNFAHYGRIDFSDVAWLDVEQRQLATRTLRSGDIVVERSGGGPKQPVGRVVYFDRNDDEFFSFSNFTSAIRVLDTSQFHPRFVFYSLLALYQSGATEDLQRRTTGIRNLDFAAYKERAIIRQLPIVEQRTIAGILDLVQRAIEQQERLLALNGELKKALFAQLFDATESHDPVDGQQTGPCWTRSPLGDVARLKSGGTPSRDVAEYWRNGDIPWVKTGEIDFGIITGTEEKITARGLTHSAARLYPAGTLLLAMYGQGVTRGRVALLGIEAATNQACAAIMPSDESVVSTPFLYYYLQHQYEELRAIGHGANQKNLSLTLLSSFPIRFPDEQQQGAIVRLLRSVDEKAGVVERRIKALSDLFRTLLHQLMTAQLRVHDLDLAALDAVVAA